MQPHTLKKCTRPNVHGESMTVYSTAHKRRREPQNIASVPPLPRVPELHPERPPPNIPIPGEPTPGGQQEQLYRCPVCGEVFSSEEELRLHMATDHPEGKSETEKTG
jgi:hypothetical protein